MHSRLTHSGLPWYLWIILLQSRKQQWVLAGPTGQSVIAIARFTGHVAGAGQLLPPALLKSPCDQSVYSTKPSWIAETLQERVLQRLHAK